ncbi:MAG: hypothetical protein ACYC1D_11075 [Acidimicrobiales bacterium]
MTSSRSPLDALLDVVLYAPVGAALTVGEELPKLATKGRTRLTGQLAMARMVGQFAVAQGRREAEKLFNGTKPHRSGPAEPAGSTATLAGEEATRAPSAPPPSEAAVVPIAPARGADILAIPGYDSLSASQVVQRLAGLSKSELDAVSSYEASHRGRRTILARVSQLQDR